MPKNVITPEILIRIKRMQKLGMTIKEIAHILQQNLGTVYLHIRSMQREAPELSEYHYRVTDPEPSLIRQKRHPPVYTNIRTPFKIGDELHSVNRILIG